MEVLKKRAYFLLREFKQDKYTCGLNVLNRIGKYAGKFGERTMIVGSQSKWATPALDTVDASLRTTGVSPVNSMVIKGAAPNSPLEDIYRLRDEILYRLPDSIVVLGGGSSIDAVKAANVLATLDSECNDVEYYFGTGKVTQALERTGKSLLPIVAIQTAAGSAAHLTKYSNVTDPIVGQKKLIVDEAIVPPHA
jgi:alcohol dehydrogenase